MNWSSSVKEPVWTTRKPNKWGQRPARLKARSLKKSIGLYYNDLTLILCPFLESIIHFPTFSFNMGWQNEDKNAVHSMCRAKHLANIHTLVHYSKELSMTKTVLGIDVFSLITCRQPMLYACHVKNTFDWYHRFSVHLSSNLKPLNPVT